MNEKNFIEKLEEILNVEESLTMETNLDDLEEWESLTALMFQSFVYKATDSKDYLILQDEWEYINFSKKLPS